jgi:hypothetical protein
VVVTVLASIGKYLLAGRHLKRAGVPSSTLIWGGIAGVIGFFAIPVVGLFVGFVLGIFVVEWLRSREARPAWRATVAALQATGLTILAMENPRAGVWARVGGDALDLAVLASGFTDDNPRKENLAEAFVAVAGITALDYWCAKRLGCGRPHGSIAAHRANVADGTAPHYRQNEPTSARR